MSCLLRRLFAMLLAAAVLAGCAAGPSRQEAKPKAPPFTNAVFVGSGLGLREAADPGIIRFNGEYWAYSTGSPCKVLKSTDLVKWEYVGKMNEEPGSCWAPDVTYKNGVFYAYMATQTTLGVEGSRRVKLYTSTRPEGPFQFQAEVTTAYSYDPDYFMDEDGQEYLYWTQECGSMAAVGPCSGNGNVGDKLIGMQKLAGQLTRIATPEGWECRGRCILEAPATLKRDGQYYQQYSGAAYENASYGGGYVRAPYPLGPGGPTEAGWVKQNKLLQTVEMKVDGPGGANWMKAPNGLDDWTIYHGRGITRQDWDRWFRIDPVMWGRDRFWLPGAPSHTPQSAPALPTFRDLFNRPDGEGLGKEWKATGGTWSVTGGAARQANAAGDARALAGSWSDQYLLETSLRFLPGQGGGSAGLITYWFDEKNHAVALVEPATNRLLWRTVLSGAVHETPLSLPEGLDWAHWQRLTVIKNGDRFRFLVNDRPIGQQKGYGHAGQVGLATAGAAAEFDGITFTHGWEDFFEFPAGWGAAEAGTAASGEWKQEGSALVQAVAQGRAESFKGSRAWGSYEFTVSIRNDGSGAAGLYAAYYDPKNFVEVLLDPKAGTLQSRSVMKGMAEMVAAPLPEGFEPTAWHTLRVVKEGFAFRFYLDGALIQERQIPLSQGQPGLLTVDTRAAYDSVRAVRWD